MIETIRPRGAINERIVIGVRSVNGKFYVVDTCRNVMEVSEQDYLMMKCKEGIKDYGIFNSTKNAHGSELP